MRRLLSSPRVLPSVDNLGAVLGIDLYQAAVGFCLPYSSLGLDSAKGDVDVLWVPMRSSIGDAVRGEPLDPDLTRMTGCELKVGWADRDGELHSMKLWDREKNCPSAKQHGARNQTSRLAVLGGPPAVLLRLIVTKPQAEIYAGSDAWLVAARAAQDALQSALPHVVTEPDDSFTTVVLSVGAVPFGLEHERGASIPPVILHQGLASQLPPAPEATHVLEEAFRAPIRGGRLLSWPPLVLACGAGCCGHLYVTLAGLDTRCPTCGSLPSVASGGA